MPDHARGHRVGGDAVDQEEAAGVAAVGVRLHRHRLVGGDLDPADVVHLQEARGMLVPVDDVEAVPHVGDRRRHRPRAGDEQVGTAVGQRLLAQPHHVDGEAVGRLRGSP